MTRLLLTALACCAASVTAALYWPQAAPAAPPASSAPVARPVAAPAPARPASPALAPQPARALGRSSPTPRARLNDGPPPTLDAEEAQVLMEVMAERGDPRSPALGGLEPRQPAPASALADPGAYAAFESEAERRQARAYLEGLKQIPAIRERIEQAAQSGERDAAQLDEARIALQQLEMLRDSLGREAPELLRDTPPTTP